MERMDEDCLPWLAYMCTRRRGGGEEDSNRDGLTASRLKRDTKKAEVEDEDWRRTLA